MRKLIVAEQISLDGVIQSPGDPEEDTSGEFRLGRWFADCWRLAGGLMFGLSATIADHESDREFNLLTGEWQARYAAF